jgi:predicted nucleic acid-binding protein
MTDRMHKRRIYFDANAFIYALEGVDEISGLLRSIFAGLENPEWSACTSEFTLAEVLPKASAVQSNSYLALILHSGLFDLLPVTRAVLIETADYRKSHTGAAFEARVSMPKLPDAIHIVSAAECNTFVSFDRGLKLPAGLERVGREEGRLLQLVQEIP